MGFIRRHFRAVLYTLAILAGLAVSSCLMLSCASTRIDPAVNSAKVETERTPATKTTRITIGGSDAKPVPVGPQGHTPARRSDPFR